MIRETQKFLIDLPDQNRMAIINISVSIPQKESVQTYNKLIHMFLGEASSNNIKNIIKNNESNKKLTKKDIKKLKRIFNQNNFKLVGAKINFIKSKGYPDIVPPEGYTVTEF